MPILKGRNIATMGDGDVAFRVGMRGDYFVLCMFEIPAVGSWGKITQEIRDGIDFDHPGMEIAFKNIESVQVVICALARLMADMAIRDFERKSTAAQPAAKE